MNFTPQFLEELGKRLTLSQFISKRTRLIKKGKDWTGLCPFHKEKSPSFFVDDLKGLYYCFGCGEGGNLISFVEKTQNVTFVEAVEHLAGIAGMQLPRSTPEDRNTYLKNQSLYEVMELATNWFEENLKSPQGAQAVQYLKNRGLTSEIIHRFRLGFAPDHKTQLQIALVAKGATLEQLHESGLLYLIEEKQEYISRFRGRIMFPIHNDQGKIIAFGGRALGDIQPKYLNSPDTPLFNKGIGLYGFHYAKQNRPLKNVLLCEGYLDVISCHQYGFHGAVAPLGTALTEAQIQLAWRLSPSPTLCFDGDAAGQKAAMRAQDRALPLINSNYTLNFISLPEGQDPDSLLKDQGSHAFQEILDRPTSFFDHLWAQLQGDISLKSPEKRAFFQKTILEHISKIQDKPLQSAYKNEVFTRLRTNTKGPQGYQVSSVSSKTRAPLNAQTVQRKIFMAAILNHPSIFDEVSERFMNIDYPETDLERLKSAIIDVAHKNWPENREDLLKILLDLGFRGTLDSVLHTNIYLHGSFAQPKVEDEITLQGWNEIWDRYHLFDQYTEDLEHAKQKMVTKMDSHSWERLKTLKQLANAARTHLDELKD